MDCEQYCFKILDRLNAKIFNISVVRVFLAWKILLQFGVSSVFMCRIFFFAEAWFALSLIFGVSETIDGLVFIDS